MKKGILKRLQKQMHVTMSGEKCIILNSSTEPRHTKSAAYNRVLIHAPGKINKKFSPRLSPPVYSKTITVDKPKQGGRVLTSDKNIKILQKQKENELKEESNKENNERI